MRQIIHPGNRRYVFLTSLVVLLFLIGPWFTELPLFFIPTDVFAGGNIYYVAPDGDDANSGSITHPWRHIQKAADTLQAGDTVYIKAGTYAERVKPQNSGSADNYITYAAYPGDTVTIDGASVLLPDKGAGLFEIAFKSYIKVSGLRVVNAGPYISNAGIRVSNSDHIIVEKNYTYNTTSSGIGVWRSQNVIIDSNEVVLACNGGAEENITIAITDIFEVKNNYVHDGGPGFSGDGSIGIDAKHGSANGKIHHNHIQHLKLGIYMDAWNKHTYNIEAYQNIIHDGVNGFFLATERGGLLENIKLYNNIIYNNDNVGISIPRVRSASVQPLKNIQIINNTLYHNGFGSWGGGIRVNNQEAQEIVIRNNICSQNLSFQIAAENVNPPGLTVDHNLVYPFTNYAGAFHGSVEVDPLFVNAAAGDFHLQPTSPAIDKGDLTDAPATDYDGHPRPNDSSGSSTMLPDLGAFELTQLTVTPAVHTINPGDVATYTLNIGPGFTGPVSLIPTNPSSDLAVQVSPNSVIPPIQVTLTITDSHPGPQLVPGQWYTVPVTVTGGITYVTSVNLLVGGTRAYLPIISKHDP